MAASKTSKGASRAVTRGFTGVLGHARGIGVLRAQQQSQRLAHAYCLTGDEGIGKTAVARALGEELLLGPGQPARLDVHPDFWSDDRPEAISIDEIRFHPEKGAQAHEQSLQQFLSLKPFVAAQRVGLLANAERMTEAAQNCLLKTLEEPPPNTVLVLTTAYPDHLLPTVVSRCQTIALTPVSRSALVAWLVDRGTASDRAEGIASLAQGRPGLALHALQDPRWVDASDRWGREISALAFEPTDSVLAYASRFGQGPQAEQRVIASEALRALTSWLRDALLVQSGTALPMATERRDALIHWTGAVPADHLRTSLATAQRTQLLIDQNVNPRLAMEVMLLDFRLGARV